MRYILIYLVIPLTALATDPVTITPEKPKPGESVTVIYNTVSEDAVIKEPAEMRVYALHWHREGKPVFREHPMKDRKGIWETTLNPLENETLYIQIKFASDDKDDDNDGSFWDILYYTAEGTVHPNSCYLMGLSWMKHPDWAATFSGAEMLRSYDREMAREVFAEGFEHYPDNIGIARMHIQFQAAGIKENEDYDTLKDELLEIASRLERTDPDNPWIGASIARMYNLLGDEEEKFKAYQERVLRKYPTHEAVELWRHSEISDREVEAEVKVERAKKFLKDFPESTQYRSAMLYLIHSLTEMEEYEEAYAHLTAYEEADPELYYNFTQTLSRHNGDPHIILESIKTILELIDNPPDMEKPSYVTNREWENRFESERWLGMIGWMKSYSHNLAASTYLDLKQIDNALVSISKAYEKSNGNNVSINTRYIEILNSAGSYPEAIEIGRDAILRNKASGELINHLKEAYGEYHGSDQGFTEFYGIARGESLSILRTELSDKMLDEHAPDFKLEQLDGDPIRLSELAGKVVVLDFWATWCGPCISAFPHFQKVVDHFSGSRDVVFLAINTWDGDLNEERIERVRDFVRDNEYTFTVLLDEDTVVGKYEVRGIPTRVTLGRDGKIRFSDIGFSGAGMYYDMTVQIDLLLDEEYTSKK